MTNYSLEITTRERPFVGIFSSVEEAKKNCPDMVNWDVWGMRNAQGSRQWIGKHISGAICQIEEVVIDQPVKSKLGK